MNTLKDLFQYFSTKKWLQEFAKVNPSGGIMHRLAGKPTNKKDTISEVKPHEVQAIKDGWQEFKNQGDKIIDAL